MLLNCGCVVHVWFLAPQAEHVWHCFPLVKHTWFSVNTYQPWASRMVYNVLKAVLSVVGKISLCTNDIWVAFGTQVWVFRFMLDVSLWQHKWCCRDMTKLILSHILALVQCSLFIARNDKIFQCLFSEVIIGWWH